MLQRIQVPVLLLIATTSLTAQSPAPAAAPSGPPSEVTFYGNPNSPISAGVVIPAGSAFVWTSGTVPPVADQQAKPDARERYGDTRTQAIGILKSIERQLSQQGLTMKDVVYLRAYLVPDPVKGNKIDTEGWNQAYGEFFGTSSNPTRTARSTVGVTALVNPAWLVEIEAFAVFPPKR